ncbi:YifB family Mg chelatase-like AAA ATPase [Aquibacillus salsiterrae]|uniref:YifB family Mg chelatase-like AAA ATPase n=1 Tax=Aquibacillus salsiterrae TaxID=2950439 RepID=A0A9X3WJU9_9BACI|nr:YifB family Mg chelatase-like AAA ATPase [Aquibacillus salsiterrae]MDC3418654.1 YifB family Mg chelatase-like AAA ATPase [Aquibacillus salsiterrae]
MVTRISSIGLRGMEGYRIQVEVHVIEGPPSFIIIGLPDLAVKESRERVLSSLILMGCNVSNEKVIVQLSPPEQRKMGPFFDIAIALGVMKEKGKTKANFDENTAFVGSLRLDGAVQSVDGLLPSLLAATRLGFKEIYVPAALETPIKNIPSLRVIPVHHLDDCLAHLEGQPTLSIFDTQSNTSSQTEVVPEFHHDFSKIIGQERAKRALVIAASGNHHLFMSGPPGCGKTLLAETYPSILPQLSDEEYLEMLSVYQISSTNPPPRSRLPFRSPHHSSSYVSLVGGGSSPKPGEASLAHHGVLFLDELPEFTKKTLDMLREPLESGKVHISRAQGTVTYPARFQLISAMNPCPCGYYGAKNRYCTCSPREIQKYHNRISGPLLDRFDIFLPLVPVSLEHGKNEGPTSMELRQQVVEARRIQSERYGGTVTNATASLDTLLRVGKVTSKQVQLIERHAQKGQWSNRVQVKILRLARTIADLNGEKEVTDQALWEAMTFQRRPVAKGDWKMFVI